MNRESFLSVANSVDMKSYESLESFIDRIFSFEKLEFSFGTDVFSPNASVKNKVGDDRKFKTFIGDTVVFELKDEDKKVLYDRYVRPFYEEVPQCFAEKLREDTLHMTLHDLNATGDIYDAEILSEMFKTELKIASLIKELELKSYAINMSTTCIFNMVNTSLVLGLVPKEEEDYEKLMYLYSKIDAIHKLPYPFTPHITLAYFNQDAFGGETLKKIECMVNYLNKATYTVELSTDRLFYQKFISMNDYFNILPFVKY